MGYDPDEHEHDFKIGDMVLCMQRCGYFFGQGGEAIRRGETRIVEWVDGGRIFTIEDPERYGPWDSESFVKMPENLTRKQIAKRIDILDHCEYSRVGVHISKMAVERNPLIQDAIDNLVGIMHGMGPYARRRI